MDMRVCSWLYEQFCQKLFTNRPVVLAFKISPHIQDYSKLFLKAMAITVTITDVIALKAWRHCSY